jgi:hypothetical protein
MYINTIIFNKIYNKFPREKSFYIGIHIRLNIPNIHLDEILSRYNNK